MGNLPSSFQRTGTVGEIVTASIKKVIPNSAFKQGDVVRALIVRTSKEVRRKDGSYIRFDDNAAVIIDKEKKDPKATEEMTKLYEFVCKRIGI